MNCSASIPHPPLTTVTSLPSLVCTVYGSLLKFASSLPDAFMFFSKTRPPGTTGLSAAPRLLSACSLWVNFLVADPLVQQVTRGPQLWNFGFQLSAKHTENRSNTSTCLQCSSILLAETSAVLHASFFPST